MTTAFVLSGGASLGAVQVGMLLALAETAIVPDVLVGTSVGAVNAAWVAGRPGPDGVRELAEVWSRLRREDVFPARPLYGLLGFAGRPTSILPDRELRALLARHLPAHRFEDTQIPLLVVAVDVLTGADVLFSEGDILDAVMASAAIPGVFPPVTIGGRAYMDGGVVNHTPISHALALGADTLWVLPTGYACSLPAPPRSALGMALHGLTLLVQQRLAADVDRYEHVVDLRVVPPVCPVTVSPADFRQSADLIARARASTLEWLASPSPPSGRVLLAHRHAQAESPLRGVLASEIEPRGSDLA